MDATTELGKAYVQIIPSAKGISGKITEALGGESASAGQAAGESWAQKLVSSAKKALAAAGLGKVMLDTVKEGAALEQALGGVETLFKDSAGKVIAAADNAFRTAGVSANDYMEQVTSFSATLLQGLGGDTDAAARYADQAILQMADNANKMGTSMEAIQNAYQGFAKDNYTMLDNLKLGYGGTQSEMARLINDSGVLGDAVEVTADTVKDVPFDQIIEAIGVIQDQLGITGTTAKEAAITLSGSFASMKAAASNVLANLTLGREIAPALNGLMQTVSTFLAGNLMPALGNILSALPGAAATLVTSLAASLQARAPGLLQSGMELLQNIGDGLQAAVPELLSKALPILLEFTGSLRSHFGEFVDVGVELIHNLVNGLIDAIPDLLAYIPDIVINIAGIINDNAPKILACGADVVIALIAGIIGNLPQIIASIPKIVEAIVSVVTAFNWVGLGQNIIQFLADGVTSLMQVIPELFRNFVNNAASIVGNFGWGALGRAIMTALGNGVSSLASLLPNLAKSIIANMKDFFLRGGWDSIGRNIITGIVSGIASAAGALFDSLANLASSALNAAKNALGIHSPSTLFRDEIGKQIPAGMALGIEGGAPTVRRALQSLTFGLEAAVPVRTAALPLGNTPALAGGGFVQTNSFTFHINESLTPAELTREAEDMAVRLRWKLP